MDLKEKVAAGFASLPEFTQYRLKFKQQRGGYSLVVVSPAFRKKSQLDRQILAERALRSSQAGLTREEIRQIGLVTPLTGKEYQRLRAANRAIRSQPPSESASE